MYFFSGVAAYTSSTNASIYISNQMSCYITKLSYYFILVVSTPYAVARGPGLLAISAHYSLN